VLWLCVLQVMASKADTGSAGKAAAGASTPPSQMKLQTLLLHPAASSVNDPYDASGPPLYQTATFGQPSATEGGQFDYTRSGNPTRTMLEEQVCGRCSGQGLVLPDGATTSSMQDHASKWCSRCLLTSAYM
jgi:hypothetical protein